MVISYVLRLRPELSLDGNISGEVEAVGTGKRAGFGSMDQLTEILMKSLPEELAKAEIADQRRSPTTANWTSGGSTSPRSSGGVQPSIPVR
jgi:hypothetical protein